MRDRLNKHFNTAVAGWAKRQVQWGSRIAQSCSCVGEDTDWPVVRCLEEVVHERRVPVCLARMPDQGEGLVKSPASEYLVVSI